MKIVISLGGSLLTKPLEKESFEKYVRILKKLGKKHKIIVVCGGGITARKYQEIGKKLGGKRNDLDFIGIMATHLNAATLATGLGKSAYFIKWKKLKDCAREVKRYLGRKIVVAGGYDIGCSTDFDSAFFAVLVKADLLINATDVDGVYSEDPKKNPKAKKFERLSYEEFLNIIKKNVQKPGEYRLFDLKGAKMLAKHKIKLIILDGRDPRNIINAINGKTVGTVIY